ncbi:ankyrin repeat protein [Cheloniid poxvirus 1]|nr:ankyrin repeat protein [Cheloniid poxvirus 1]
MIKDNKRINLTKYLIRIGASLEPEVQGKNEVKPCKLEISEQDINYISNKFKMFKSIIKLKLNEYMNKVNGI